MPCPLYQPLHGFRVNYRHLVLNKDTKTKSSRQDKIHYEYDEHYFLTDPDEFIQEFWATDKEWQLLDRWISLEEFEDLPFVRSVFFHCGLEFRGSPKAVLLTDPAGGTEVRIDVPEENSRELVFHYQLRYVQWNRVKQCEHCDTVIVTMWL